MDDLKEQFLEREFRTNSITAAIVRGKDNPTYVSNASPDERIQLGRTFRAELRRLQPQYESVEFAEPDHVRNIAALAKKVTDDCKDFLAGEKLCFGRAQKGLNLYLKYLWCVGRVKLPPHCPFDSKVIGKLPSPLSAIAWTKLDDEATYLDLVKAARAMAEKESLTLTEWEIRLFAAAQDKEEARVLKIRVV
jgi:hypothetical protein